MFQKDGFLQNHTPVLYGLKVQFSKCYLLQIILCFQLAVYDAFFKVAFQTIFYSPFFFFNLTVVVDLIVKDASQVSLQQI